MNGLLTGAEPVELLEVQADLLSDRATAGGTDWAARDVMYYDRVARLGIAGFSFAECDALQSARVREVHGRDFCMLPTAVRRHAELVEISKFFPIR